MFWQMHDMQSVGSDHFTVGVGKHVKLAASRSNFLQVGLQLLQQCVVGRHRNHRHVLVDQCQRSVLQLPGRIGFGVDVADFLEFEGAFKCDRVVPSAPGEQGVLLHGKVLGPFADQRFQFEHLGYRNGQVTQCLQFGGFGLLGESAA